jgi:hypothetical protein
LRVASIDCHDNRTGVRARAGRLCGENWRCCGSDASAAPNATLVVPLGKRLAGTVVAAVREDIGEPP